MAALAALHPLLPASHADSALLNAALESTLAAADRHASVQALALLLERGAAALPACNRVMQDALRAREWRTAVDTFHSMLQAGIRPDSEAVHLLASACRMGSQAALGMQMWHAGRALGAQLTDRACAALVRMLADEPRGWPEALALVAELEAGAAPQPAPPPAEGPAGSVATLQLSAGAGVYEALAQALARGAQRELVLRLLRRLVAVQEHSAGGPFRTAAEACVEAGDGAGAVAVLQLWCGAGGPLHAARVAAGTAHLARLAGEACVRARDAQSAVALLAALDAAGVAVPGAALHSAVRACVLGMRWRELNALVPRLVAQLRLQQQAQPAAAADLPAAADAAEAGDAMRGADGEGRAAGRALAEALRGLAAAEQAPRALSVVKALRAEGVALPEEVYREALGVAAREGEWQLAEVLLRDFAQRVGRVPTAGMYFDALRACARAGKWQRGNVMVEGMLAAGVVPSQRLQEMVRKVRRHAKLRALK